MLMLFRLGPGAMEREETEEDRLFSAPSREVHPKKKSPMWSWVKNHSKV